MGVVWVIVLVWLALNFVPVMIIFAARRRRAKRSPQIGGQPSVTRSSGS